MRTKKKDLVEDSDECFDDDVKDPNEYIDIQFQRIRSKLNIDPGTDFIQSASKNKFTLQTTDGSKERQYDDNQTFVDGLFKNLGDHNVTREKSKNIFETRGI